METEGRYWSVQECRWVRTPCAGDPLATPWSEVGVPVPDLPACQGFPSLAADRARVPGQRPAAPAGTPVRAT